MDPSSAFIQPNAVSTIFCGHNWFPNRKHNASNMQPQTNDDDSSHQVTFDEEQPVARPARISPSGTGMTRGLTQGSVPYDRDGKGYLDDTEQALRRMDSKNLGHLDNDKVYGIMKSLREEQMRSADWLEEVRREHNRAMGLKNTVVLLSIFATILAISNVGTSFVAARLARDTDVYAHDLVSLDGVRLATTSKTVEVQMTPLSGDSRRRRHLQEIQAAVCGASDITSDIACEFQGEITLSEVTAMHQQFCPNYPSGTSCSVGGVEKVLLHCNDVDTIISAVRRTPTVTADFIIFPEQGRSYPGVQDIPQFNFGINMAGFPCKQNFAVGFYCPPNEDEICYAFANFQRTCLGTLQLCGAP